ncbi:DNA-formamidopyrimidine glycosylase [Paenibacillus thermotolerans]|uniref:DNA-formamidopyrimidine glycosylase n=1 Tax=Paenibacillus thermotolerans TaxID=3027807 RepID=UPI002368E369|nr:MULTISPECIES: DNA-formamidopyrimidine glycosylase [unclassified Paenibacillus]
MPELPEVETVRRTLSRLIEGKKISRVDVHLPRIVRRPAEPERFAAALEGQTFRSVERRGKFLRFILDELVLVSHLRMEGRYGLFEAGDPLEKHTHVVFAFTDGTELRYRDVRQFGTMDLFRPGEEFSEGPLHKLGMEPLSDEFTFEAFRKRIGNRETKIKPLLLNQEHVVGIGNIYVDESLFRAGIHPEREARSLAPSELKRLHEAIVGTLKEAVDAGGSSVKSYVNGQGEQGSFQYSLQVYGRKQEACVNCGTPIEKTVVGGRGTHYCPHCQPLKKRR